VKRHIAEPAVLKLPVVNSEYLFRSLATLFGADLICDVGAYDCFHSKRFRSLGVRVAALEANPRNFAAITADSSVREAGIEVFHLAATNRDGVTEFNLVNAPVGEELGWLGPISSIRPRADDYRFESEAIAVPATRLDTFVLEKLQLEPSTIALWVDVEGCGYEALEGIEGIRDRVCVVHVEVELLRFWEEQRLWPDIAALMQRLGFTPIVRRPGDLQVDVIFVNDRAHKRFRLRVRWHVCKAWCRLRAAHLKRILRLGLSRLLGDRLR